MMETVPFDHHLKDFFYAVRYFMLLLSQYFHLMIVLHVCHSPWNYPNLFLKQIQ